MRRIRLLTVLIALLLSGINQNCFPSNPNALGKSYKVLFIGSSYFNFNNLPGLVENLADEAGNRIVIDQNIPSGYSLNDHVNSSETTSKIKEQDWDFIVLQGSGARTAYPDQYQDQEVVQALEILKDRISRNCESTKIIFAMPWAFEDGMSWIEGNTDKYDDMQIKIYNNTLAFSKELGLIVAPVGWAWLKVLVEKDYPLHYLHMNDWNHPTMKGSYLSACVVYSTIFQESTRGNPYHAWLIQEEAEYLQEAACTTVLNSMDLWNILRNKPLK